MSSDHGPNADGATKTSTTTKDTNPDGDDSKTVTPSPTSNSSTTTDLIGQILRDGQPFTRPTRWSYGLQSFEDGVVANWKLFPGAYNTDGITASVAVRHAGAVSPHWALIHALISVDEICWPEPLPGMIYIPTPDTYTLADWSCAIHFPRLAVNERLGGTHTLLLRAYPHPREKR